MGKVKELLLNNEKVEFHCMNCGNCCSIDGHVFINQEEISAISKYMAITIEEFLEKFTVSINDRIRIKGDYYNKCIFLDNNSCRIYSVRPKQCKTFPYWLENMKYDVYIEETVEYCSALKNIEKGTKNEN